MTSTDTLLPCPFCGGEARLLERPNNAANDEFFCAVSCMCGGYSAKAHQFATSATADTAKAEAIAAWNRRTPPTPATEEPAFNDHGCIYCRAQGSDCEGPHKFATEEREAVARALYEAVNGSPTCYRWDDSGLDDEHPGTRNRYYRQADAALSALAPVRAAEILAAEANERARIVAWLRDCKGGCGIDAIEAMCDAADQIERNEHGAGK